MRKIVIISSFGGDESYFISIADNCHALVVQDGKGRGGRESVSGDVRERDQHLVPARVPRKETNEK